MHLHAYTMRVREGEIAVDRGESGPLHRRPWPAECQLSDPAYWPHVPVRYSDAVRTQEQYPDDYRVAGVA